MLLQTTFTQAMAILHPIALAPMGGGLRAARWLPQSPTEVVWAWSAAAGETAAG